ncbi:mannose-6-phosphate isomerase [Defluviimonas sp. 20V17]|uniref:Mannose-6-phosphate isomerase n=1 Tax=Allgaiera indica TaxID=765699 RepID=A0AAN4UV32_9RHOB|nr:cupin domain-containing protein [Allgaiera indica]KDB04396.1 mannose-6-phosphate isomerase [Defluviimonas sp. 20V17]GHE06245.1 mannose-6-phosphate isomerase [Allgaiera indica]SDX89021.1 Mannose-6-phosphate isomerase, cupin superfamily [Allgaiera indica]
MEAVNLAGKLAMFDSHWDPHVVAGFNGNDIMVVKVQGEFPLHSHPDTDDFFLVLEGEIELDVGDETVVLREGELFVVPAGVIHRPRAAKEAKLLLIEPKGTPNTGDPTTASAKPRI